MPQDFAARAAGYLKDVRYKDWDIHIRMDGDRPYLQIGFRDFDWTKAGGEKEYQHGRKWMLSPHMTKSEIVQTAFKAVMMAEEHETREKFTYKGRTIFGPHFSVDKLAALCDGGAVDIRKTPLKEAV